MTRSLYAIPAMLYLATAIVAAQVPAGDQRPVTSSPSSQQPAPAMNGNKITYVGCIKPGTSNGTWMLQNAEAKMAGTTDSKVVGTSGGSTTTLNLHPAATVNLKAHANHKVEIVGMKSNGPDATAPAVPKGGEAAAGVTGPTDAKVEAGSGASASHFSVESLKMISGTCP